MNCCSSQSHKDVIPPQTRCSSGSNEERERERQKESDRERETTKERRGRERERERKRTIRPNPNPSKILFAVDKSEVGKVLIMSSNKTDAIKAQG